MQFRNFQEYCAFVLVNSGTKTKIHRMLFSFISLYMGFPYSSVISTFLSKVDVSHFEILHFRFFRCISPTGQIAVEVLRVFSRQRT